MKLGIAKFEYIDSRNLNDYGSVPPGSSISMSAFVKQGKSFSELPFTMGTADLSEQWSTGSGGKASDASFSASVRADRMRYRPILQQLVGKKCIFRVTLVSGERCIIGSPLSVPTFSFDENVSGISSSEFSISVKNRSRHGILYDSDSL